MRRNAEFFGAAPAVVVPGGRTTSWAELEERTNRLARAFLALGLAKGDRVAIFAPNCGEYIDFFFACAKSGVIGAPLNIRLAPYELTHYFGYVEPRAVLVHTSLVTEARAFLAELPAAPATIGLGEGHGLDFDRGARFRPGGKRPGLRGQRA